MVTDVKSNYWTTTFTYLKLWYYLSTYCLIPYNLSTWANTSNVECDSGSFRNGCSTCQLGSQHLWSNGCHFSPGLCLGRTGIGRSGSQASQPPTDRWPRTPWRAQTFQSCFHWQRGSSQLGLGLLFWRPLPSVKPIDQVSLPYCSQSAINRAWWGFRQPTRATL